MWSVSSILTGLVSFMVETSKTVGCIETTARPRTIGPNTSAPCREKTEPQPVPVAFLSSVAVCLGLAARIASRLWQRSVHLRWLPAWAGAFSVTAGCTETGVRKGLVPC